MDKDLKKPFINKDKKETKDPEVVDDLENRTVAKKPQTKGAKDDSKDKKKSSWGDSETIKDYGVFYTLRFAVPLLWRGSWVSKIQLLITILLTLAAKALAVIHPIVLKYVIDNLSVGNSTYYLIGLYVIVRLASEACNLTREITFAAISASAEVQIASQVYNHIQNLSLNYHLSRETGKIVRICSKGSQSFAQILRFALFIIGPLFLEIALVIVSIGLIFPYWFFILVLVCIIAYLVDTFAVTEWRAKYFKRMNLKDNAYVQKATDGLLNFETVKYFNAEKHERDRYLTALNEYKVENVATTNSMVILNVSQSFLVFVSLILNLMLAAWMIDRETLAVGDFVLLNTYILQVYGPLFYLGTFWRFIKQAMVDVEQIFELLDIHDYIKEPKRPDVICKNEGEVEFKNVSFAYDKDTDKMLIDNINFKVEPGQSVALVGATGAGKSTIMRLLYRFYDVREGNIYIDGQDIAKLRTKELRSKIAIVPQDTVLFNDTIKYNLAYGGVSDPAIKEMMDDPDREEELMEKLRKVAKNAQILDFIESKAKGFDEVVGERGLKLSGGEKQRVSIARALLKRCPIMLFDEATSALDTATEKEIEGAINNASRNTTTIMIAHRLSTIKNCDKIIVLKNGTIIEEGSHQELYDQDGEYRMLWDKQTEMQQREQQKKDEEQAVIQEREKFLEERASMRKRKSSAQIITTSKSQISK